MKESVEYLVLNTIKKHGSIMPLFKAGYSYSKVMEWGRCLEKQGKIYCNEIGVRELTAIGEQRLNMIKSQKEVFQILPLKEYKMPNLEIDEIYLP